MQPEACCYLAEDCNNCRTTGGTNLGKLDRGLPGNTGVDALLGLAELNPKTRGLVGVGLTEGGGERGGGEIGLLGRVTSDSKRCRGGTNDQGGGRAAVHRHAYIAGGAAKADLSTKTRKI